MQSLLKINIAALLKQEIGRFTQVKQEKRRHHGNTKAKEVNILISGYPNIAYKARKKTNIISIAEYNIRTRS